MEFDRTLTDNRSISGGVVRNNAEYPMCVRTMPPYAGAERVLLVARMLRYHYKNMAFTTTAWTRNEPRSII